MEEVSLPTASRIKSWLIALGCFLYYDYFVSYSFLNIFFWLNLFYFFLVAFVSFYIPGRIVLGKSLQGSKLFLFVSSVITGLVLWGWQGFIFGFFHVRFLTYIYLLVFVSFYIKNFISFKKELCFTIKNFDILAVILIIIGVFVQVFQLFFSGLPDNGGIRFHLTGNDDGVWHVALTNQLVKNVPPTEPGLNGTLVANYHYFGNIINAELIRIFGLPSLNLHFQYMNIFLSLFLGLCGYVMAITITKEKSVARWFLFLLYLGGDLIYYITIFTRHALEFGVHPIEEGTSFLENPPRAFSILIAIAGMMMFYVWTQTSKKKFALLTAFLLGSVVGYKVYTGIIILSGFIVASIFISFTRKHVKFMIPVLLASAVSFIMFMIDNAKSGGLFLDPFWQPINFVVQPKLNLSFLELRRRVYMIHNNTRGILQMEAIMTAIFLVTQFGTRLLGFIQTKSSMQKLGIAMSSFLFTGVVSGIVIGTLFLQTSGGSNSFNFYIAASLPLAFLAAYTLGRWTKTSSKILIAVIVVLMVLLNVPRIIYKTNFVLHSYTTNWASFYVNSGELSAMEYLRNKTPDNALVMVDNNGTADYLTPYVSFFSNRPMFLSGQNILLSHNVSIANKQSILNKILTSTDAAIVLHLLKENNIKYLYMTANQTINVKPELIGRVVFSNNSAQILKVD